jgi:N-acyl-D-amino-acid deacylase
VVGQDGIWKKPVKDQLADFDRLKPALNFAMFSGHGGIRSKVMGKGFERAATPGEQVMMDGLVEADMEAGALGLSSGLEYDPGHYSTTEELISMASVAGRNGGMYISHVRDEGNGALESFRELIRIGREAKCPAQVSHIKLGTQPVWGQAGQAIALFEEARREGVRITADIYPYLYWQSSITAMTVSREFDKLETWQRALDETGGGKNVLLTKYSPEPSWQGKTVGELAAKSGKTEAAVVLEIVQKTQNGKGEESAVVTAMTDADLPRFAQWRDTMFCSDGAIGGSHPRGAGSFPRVLGLFVRGEKWLTLEDAVRKMAYLPASTFKLTDRGEIRPGAFADVVVFDPSSVQDMATPKSPTALSQGVKFVWVNGQVTLRDGKVVGRAGRALRRGA